MVTCAAPGMSPNSFSNASSTASSSYSTSSSWSTSPSSCTCSHVRCYTLSQLEWVLCMSRSCKSPSCVRAIRPERQWCKSLQGFISVLFGVDNVFKPSTQCVLQTPKTCHWAAVLVLMSLLRKRNSPLPTRPCYPRARPRCCDLLAAQPARTPLLMANSGPRPPRHPVPSPCMACVVAEELADVHHCNPAALTGTPVISRVRQAPLEGMHLWPLREHGRQFHTCLLGCGALIG